MTINYCIQIGDRLSSKKQQEVITKIEEVFLIVHQVFNDWNPESEISKVNSLLAYEKKPLSPLLYEFLISIKHLVEKTEGAFDPTIGSLQKCWKDHLKKGALPDAHLLAPLEQAVGWHHIYLEEGSIWKDNALTAIDLGGVAKGLAVDLLTDALIKLGIKNSYVEWGGEIRTTGRHPSCRSWNILLPNGQIIPIENKAIATSGTLYQKWKVQEKTYSHLLNPKTKQPCITEKDAYVTVTSTTCKEADALATALFICPALKEKKELSQYPILFY